MHLISYSRYKKRVVSTLFLYIIILLLGCDFKSPEEWETPGWYTNLTLPLINKEYSFGELLSDTMFFSDTLNVALPSDTVSNVIHLTYNIILDPQQIPDSIFDIDMSIVNITIPDFGGLGDPILLPDPDFEEEVPIIEGFDTGDGDCFLKSLAEVQTLEEITGSLPTDSFPVGNDFLEIRTIFISTMTWNIRVENGLPFPITVEEFSIKNGGISLFTSAGLENIMPYTSDSSTDSNSPDSLDLTEDFTFTVKTKVGDADTNCDIPGLGSGWSIEEGNASLKIFFGCVFGLIDSVRVFTNSINQTKTMQNPVPGYGEMEVYRAKMALSTEDYPNKVFLDIANDFYLPVDITLTFHNFFDSVGINQWDSLKTLIEIEPFSESNKYTIDYSESILSATKPITGVSALLGDPITSINLDLSVKIDSGEVTLRTTEIDGKSYITQTGPIDSIRIGNMSLEYIEAIAHELTFEAPSVPIGGIPTGFTDIEFVDLKFGIGLFNEIGIPMSLNLDIVGKRKLVTHSVNIPNLEIGVPFGTSKNCVFDLIGDTARTDILLTKDSLHTVYYCNNDTSLMINDALDDQSNLVELVNIVPEQFIVNGAVKMNGKGRMAKGTDIWGTFILETPLSFRFKKQMTIIPEDPWPLAPIDDPETSEKINSSLIEGEFFVDITNKSSLGGSLSLLISDSTIFPLFLDSMITGTWENNRQHQITEWDYYFQTNPETATNQPWVWDSLGIEVDSISYTAIDPSDDESKALEVQFFHQDSLQFFVGRMFEIVFPPADSIDYSWGYATPAFPGLYTSSVKLDTTILSWLITDDPRNSTAIITFDGSPFQLTDGTYRPVTLETTNAIEVQAYLTLKLDTGELIE